MPIENFVLAPKQLFKKNIDIFEDAGLKAISGEHEEDELYKAIKIFLFKKKVLNALDPTFSS